MIGYLKPYFPELKVKELELYKALYCGFCLEQYRQNDVLTRLAFPSDSIFIYLLFLEAIEKVDFTMKKKFCPFSPIGMRLVFRETQYLPLFAEIQRTLTSFKFLDNSNDEKRKKKLFSLYRLKKVIYRLLAKSELRKNTRMQLYMPDKTINIFDDFFYKERQFIHGNEESNTFFRHVSNTIIKMLPIDYLSSDAKGHIEIILHNIIKVIYILDALDDYSKDSKNMAFNIIAFQNNKIGQSNSIDLKTLQNMEKEVNLACNLALEHYNMLPYHHNRGLMENFFCYSLPLQYKKLAEVYKNKIL